MINLKDKKINNVYLGGKKINKIYLGNKKVFGNKLPNEYQEVEYIESSGTQYIDTGIYNNGSMIIELVASMNEKNEQQAFFGAHNGANVNNAQIRLYTGMGGDIDKLQYNYGESTIISWATSISNLNTTNKTKYTFGNGIFNINDIPYQTYNIQTFTNTQTSILFGAKSQEGLATYLSSMKVYSFKITDNNTLIRNFIPCYRNSDNEVGMYDLVNNVFYTNAGTGTFIKGSDV